MKANELLAGIDLDSYERTNEMSLIDGGTFVMGSDVPILVQDGEAPARRAKMSPFFLDVHEVSNAEFARFVRDTGHKVCSLSSLTRNFIFYLPRSGKVMQNCGSKKKE